MWAPACCGWGQCESAWAPVSLHMRWCWLVIQSLLPDKSSAFLELYCHRGLNLCTLPIPHRILHKYAWSSAIPASPWLPRRSHGIYHFLKALFLSTHCFLTAADRLPKLRVCSTSDNGRGKPPPASGVSSCPSHLPLPTPSPLPQLMLLCNQSTSHRQSPLLALWNVLDIFPPVPGSPGLRISSKSPWLLLQL